MDKTKLLPVKDRQGRVTQRRSKYLGFEFMGTVFKTNKDGFFQMSSLARFLGFDRYETFKELAKKNYAEHLDPTGNYISPAGAKLVLFPVASGRRGAVAFKAQALLDELQKDGVKDGVKNDK